MTYAGATISSEEERIAMCEQCKWVDEVLPHAPWVITEGTSRHIQNSSLKITSISSAMTTFPTRRLTLMMPTPPARSWASSGPPRGPREFQQLTWSPRSSRTKTSTTSETSSEESPARSWVSPSHASSTSRSGWQFALLASTSRESAQLDLHNILYAGNRYSPSLPPRCHPLVYWP